MKWVSALGDLLFNIIVYISIILGFLFLGAFIRDIHIKYQALQNQEEQIEEIYDQQVYLLNLLDKYQRYNSTYLNGVVNDIKNVKKKPSYEYLKSVTVYIFKQDEPNSNMGGIGTGTIVAKIDDYYYILTNKHVCDEKDANKCFITQGLSAEGWIELDYVKRTESKYDLSLWRTKEMFPNKKAINGVAMAYPQNEIYSVGNYLANPYVYTEGTFAGYKGNTALFNMSCAQGCSGSGIFNNDGYLVGVVYAGNMISGLQMDTTKMIGINGDVIRLFLKDIIEEGQDS